MYDGKMVTNFMLYIMFTAEFVNPFECKKRGMKALIKAD